MYSEMLMKSYITRRVKLNRNRNQNEKKNIIEKSGFYYNKSKK